MPQARAKQLARYAYVFGGVGLLLWLLSYSWVPFALAGREMGSLFWVPFVSELAAVLAATLGIRFSLGARRQSEPGTPEHRSGSRSLLLAAAVIVLVVGLNIVGVLVAPS